MCEYIGWMDDQCASESEDFEVEGVDVEHVEYATEPEPQPSDLFFETEDEMVWVGTGAFGPWFDELVGKLKGVALDQDLGEEEMPYNMEDW